MPEAAARELREETGLEVALSSLMVLGVRRYQVDGARGVDFLFRVQDVRGTPEPLHKTSEVAWFAVGDWPHDALPWIAPVLTAFLDGGARGGAADGRHGRAGCAGLTCIRVAGGPDAAWWER